MKKWLLIFGFLLLILSEVLRVYFIMPFPGSQQMDSIGWAYFIEKYKWLLRIAGLLLIFGPVYRIFSGKKLLFKILISGLILLYGVIYYLFNFRFEADKMFYQPGIRNFSGEKRNHVDSNKLVIGVLINGEAKAYPIQLIGYHHQVRDTVGNTPVMITYCTVCRTGRVYSPVVKGKSETFRLVGMDHFNAMFEDVTTRSWWRQATGEAIAGPLKGNQLEEIPSRQASLASWLRDHPDATILQPDSNFIEDYNDLAGFDKGTVKSHLEKRDTASWNRKSWIIGLKTAASAKAYDWNYLQRTGFIQDSMGFEPILLILEQDSGSFHAYNRIIRRQQLFFIRDKTTDQLTDTNTRSIWSMEGICISGILKDARMQPVAAYQEFWHSWKQFHPNTTVYVP